MRLPVNRIRQEAAQLHLARLLLGILVAPLYVLGWLGGKVAVVIMLVVAAVKVGWQDARGSAR